MTDLSFDFGGISYDFTSSNAVDDSTVSQLFTIPFSTSGADGTSGQREETSLGGYGDFTWLMGSTGAATDNASTMPDVPSSNTATLPHTSTGDHDAPHTLQQQHYPSAPAVSETPLSRPPPPQSVAVPLHPTTPAPQQLGTVVVNRGPQNASHGTTVHTRPIAMPTCASAQGAGAVSDDVVDEMVQSLRELSDSTAELLGQQKPLHPNDARDESGHDAHVTPEMDTMVLVAQCQDMVTRIQEKGETMALLTADLVRASCKLVEVLGPSDALAPHCCVVAPLQYQVAELSVATPREALRQDVAHA